MPKLDSIVREEIDTEHWKDKPVLVERVLIRLNRLHRFAVNRVILLGRQIKDVGGAPDIKVTVVWPPSEALPEPEEV